MKKFIGKWRKFVKYMNEKFQENTLCSIRIYEVDFIDTLQSIVIMRYTKKGQISEQGLTIFDFRFYAIVLFYFLNR